MKNYAVQDMDLAIQYHLKQLDPNSQEYGLEKSAMDNVQELLDVIKTQGHSGASIHYVVSQFNRMVRNLPLSPLEDTEDSWIFQDFPYRGEICAMYQHKLYSSVFKYVMKDGTVEYHDVNAVVFTTPDGLTFTTGREIDGVKGDSIVDFPYYPTHRKVVHLNDTEDKILSIEELPY